MCTAYHKPQAILLLLVLAAAGGNAQPTGKPVSGRTAWHTNKQQRPHCVPSRTWMTMFHAWIMESNMHIKMDDLDPE